MNPDTRHAPSYYAATANPSPPRPPLEGEVSCDVCIVGAGYSGLSAGLHLAEAGYKVVVLEAAKVGWGESGRNGGQLVNGFSRDFDVIRARYGEDTARAFTAMSFEGADIIRERISTYKIKCDHKNVGTFFAAFTPGQLKYLEQRQRLWEEFGNTALEMYSRDRVPEIIGTDIYCGGLLDRRGGHMHPLNLALGEAAAIESLGGRICEHSAVTRIEKKPKPEVHTDRGKVTADYVILCNADLGKSLPGLFSRIMPVSTQVITTEILDDETARRILPGDNCVEDCNYVLDYYRLTGDKRLLFGGGIIYGGAHPRNIDRRLRPHMLKTFPFLEGRKIQFSWSGTMTFTFTRLPHVGRLSDNIYFVQGYSGHGVTTSHLMGRLFAEAIRQQSSRLDVFSAVRHFPWPGGRIFRVPLTAMGAWYYQMKEKLGL